MVAQPFDLEANHPLFPRKEILAEYEKVGFDYDETIEDRVYKRFYELSTSRPVRMEIPQMYRLKKPGSKEGEYIFYNVKLTGSDWKGNDTEFTYVKGRYEKPIFKLEKNPETQKLSAKEVNSHQRVYDIPFTKESFDKLLEAATDPLSLIVMASSGKKFGIQSVDEFRNGSIDDLIISATKGKSLDAVVAEKNTYTYERREIKPTEITTNKK